MPTAYCPFCRGVVSLLHERQAYTCPHCGELVRDGSEDPREEKRVATRRRLAILFLIGCAVFAVLCVVGSVVWVIRRDVVIPLVQRDEDRKPQIRLTDKERATAEKAIQSLGKVEAFTQTGVNLIKYSELVGNAKADVNEAKRELPHDSETGMNLSDAMDAYDDAGRVWDHKIKFEKLGLREEFGHGNLIKKYNLPIRDKDGYGMAEKNADCNIAIQIIWLKADEKLSSARLALIKESR